MTTRRATAWASVALLAAGAWRADASSPQQEPAPPAPSARLYSPAWKHEVKVPGAPVLAVGAAGVFITSAEAGVTALARDDGHALWAAELIAGTSLATVGNLVGVVSGATLHALDQASGRPLWRADIGAGAGSVRLHSSDSLFVTTAGPEVRAWALDGSEAWRRTLEAPLATRLVTHGGLLIAGLETPELVALDMATGTVQWRRPLPARPTSLAAADDRIFLAAADGALYSYKTTGARKQAWRYRQVEAIGEPVVDARHVYFTLIDNTVRAFDRNGGSQRWSRVVASRPVTGPMLAGDEVLVALDTGHVVQLAARTGQLPGQPTAPAVDGVRLPAAAATADGTTVFTLVVAGDDSRTLTAWRLPAVTR